MATRYALLRANGEVVADPETAIVFTFATMAEARRLAMPGERVVDAKKIVPVPPQAKK